MSKSSTTRTAAQEILLGAKDLSDAGNSSFSEWDLTVSVWKRSPNRFGCRGYEDRYPDHKRVMTEIMGTTKKDNPLRRGWIKKTKPNFYQLTDIGLGEAERLLAESSPEPTIHRSAQPIYDAVERYYSHGVFRKFCKDREEPRMWLGAASFLNITRNDAQHLEDKLREVRTAIAAAKDWLEKTGNSHINRGVTGGGISITKTDLVKLEELVQTICQRHALQIEAVMRTKR